MTQAALYRAKAAEFAHRATTAPSEALQAEHATMAAAYLRLADQAERNATHETPDADPVALAERMVGSTTRAVRPK